MEQKNTEKPKVKCKRVLQPVRWADAATEQLLQLIADEIKKHPSSFDVQKYIAQQCCDKLSSKYAHPHKPSCCCQKNRSRCYKIHQMSARKPRNETVTDSSDKVFPCYEILNKTASVKLKADDLVFYINPITNEILDEGAFKAYRSTPEPESEMRNDGGGTSNVPDFMLSKEEMQLTSETLREDDPKPSLSFSASVPNLHMSTMSLGGPIIKKKLSFQWTESVTDHFLNLITEEIEKHPGTFEKPTEQKFYKNISAVCPQLKTVHWTALKRKMESFQISYIKARLWRKEIGAAMLAKGNEEAVIGKNYKSFVDLMPTPFAIDIC
ncbi:uncharacterized protein ACN2A1_008222 [Glossina fuscipes fuscipes]